jgi:hypothetical protein
LGALGDHLYRAGLADEAIGRIFRAMGALRLRAHRYALEGQPSEPETAAQLVLPLLQALGWPPQLTALEWNHIDIALFRRLPRDDKNLEAIIEVKRLGTDCFKALPQATRYGKARPGCRRLVVTDGACYGIYRREAGGFTLHAYLDLHRPRDSYPALSCHGTQEALLSLLPAGPSIH